MGNTSNSPGDDEGNGSDDEATGDDTGTTGHEDCPFNETPRHTNTGRREDLTVEEATHLVQCYNLPERTVTDVQAFQQVFFELHWTSISTGLRLS